MICSECKRKKRQKDMVCEICAALDKMREFEQFQEEMNWRFSSERNELGAVR